MQDVSGKNSFWMESQIYISVLLGTILCVLEGGVGAWTSPLLEKLRGNEDNPLGRELTSDEYSLLASIAIPGAIVGAILVGSASKYVGRKTLLLMLSFPSFISFLMLAFSRTLWLFIVARIIGGLGFGGTFTLLPMYICELADPKLRGRLCSTIGISMNFGQLLTYCIGPYISFFYFHIIFATIPIIFFVLFYNFASESPYYLLQNDPLKAEKVLKKLRGKDDVSEEFIEMRRSGNRSYEKGTFSDILKSRAARQALFIGLGLAIFNDFTGGFVINGYTELIFKKAGGNWSAEIETIVIGSVQLCVIILASFITDKFGRKTLLSISYVGVAFWEIVLGLYFYLNDNGTDLSNFGWLPLASLVGYTIALNIGVGILGPTVFGELFPLNVKGAGIGLCTITSTALGFGTRLVFQRVEGVIGMGPLFWIFGGFGIGAVIFIKMFLIETKGKTLEEVQDELNGSKRKNFI